ncbi:MAG: 4-(cytidine 5'-diphospho)-2-C-methyl-D-erythritol kinase [Proteobacteria bacterium]|nr:4-(cytidine 5'-diphospho)-2-C-methyl-D-erythritol kinase [Pseudomonadota bacterium]
MTKLLAPAKINLTLHVTSQRSDGLHLLDSLIVFTKLGDILSFKSANKTSLSVTGLERFSFPVDQNNIILKAANLAGSGYQREIFLKKILPVSSGIGGGSADAAATLRDIAHLGFSVSQKEIFNLGADVPACLKCQPLRVQGVGETFQVIPNWPKGGALILVNPRIPLSTSKVFNALLRKDNEPMETKIPFFKNIKSLANFVLKNRNDLQDTSIKLEPEISKVLISIKKTEGCLIARMSGSGATCFGLFETLRGANEAASRLRKDFPNWWINPSDLTVTQNDLKPFS